jgi:hypothetical protein
VPRDTRDGGCRDRGCADAVEARMGEVEFIARVEEVAGPEYVRVAGPEAGGGPSLSSVGREVQQPYIQEHSASVLSAEVAQEMQQAKVNHSNWVRTFRLSRKKNSPWFIMRDAQCVPNKCEAQIPIYSLCNPETT